MPLPTHLEAITRRSARLEVYERLRQWIEEGTLAPGEVIRDAEIARALGVSRTPVREALQILGSQGAIETVAGRDTKVASAEPADAHLVYPPLAVLHGLAAEIAAPLATQRDLAEMADANERLLRYATSTRPGRATDANHEFHAILVARAANPHLASAIDALEIHVRRLETLFFKGIPDAQASYDAHLEIMDAVRQRNSSKAGLLTRQNVGGIYAYAHGSVDARSKDDETHQPPAGDASSDDQRRAE